MGSIETDVTILIPNLNGAKFLEEAIESCLRQTYYSKILVIDNNSSDESIEILKKYKEIYGQFEFDVCFERGISAALNFGLAQVNTKFTCRLDSDDYMEPERVAQQIKYLSIYPSIALLGTQIRFVDQNGKKLGISSYATGTDSVQSSLCWSNPIAHPSVIFRTEEIRNIGGYRSEFDGAEDLDLWIRISKLFQIDNLNLPLTNYRKHPEQVSVRNALEKREYSVRKNFFPSVIFSSEFSFLNKRVVLNM